MPLRRASTSYFFLRDEDVDGRVKPGHDGTMNLDLPVGVVEPSGNDEIRMLRRLALLAVTAWTPASQAIRTIP
jgi:hypothetical protein